MNHQLLKKNSCVNVIFPVKTKMPIIDNIAYPIHCNIISSKRSFLNFIPFGDNLYIENPLGGLKLRAFSLLHQNVQVTQCNKGGE